MAEPDETKNRDAVSVPITAPKPASPSSSPSQPSASASGEGEVHRTDPLSFVVQAIAGLRSAVFPVLAALFVLRDEGFGLSLAILIGLAVIILSGVRAWLAWRKFTYQVNAEDIRVEYGILSRAARSVPFERIQDVSLEQALIPRFFGLVEVKFETGSGGGEDLKLAYLSEEEGERLREVVRERREGETQPTGQDEAGTDTPAVEEDAQALFTMDTQRLFTFGLFEFSLAVFAVLGGLAQYAETFMGIELWDPDLWRGWVESQQGFISSLGPMAQILSAIAGFVALLVIGSATGLARTFAREWGFILEKTARGFRRRRGLFTRTDVVMPAHRVQAVEIGTGLIRYRFGWHGLKFVSLAQDAGSSSHVVAPFAQREEIDPIIRAAGFEPPAEDLDWHRASKRYRTDSTIIDAAFFLLAAIPVAIFAPTGFVLIPLALAGITALANYFGWRFHRHALDPRQVIASRGVLSPRTKIGSRVKLHSVEIRQGPIAQRRGYATLHLGLAGGDFAIPGIPLERARELRSAITESIVATDFSQLDYSRDQSARKSDQSGFSSNLAAT